MLDAKAVGVVIDGLSQEKHSLQIKLEGLRAQIGSIQAEMNSVKARLDDVDVTLKVLGDKGEGRRDIRTASEEQPPTLGENVPTAFPGQTWASAAKPVLEAGGRPIKTADILKRLEEGGMQFKGTRPYANLYSALSRSKLYKLTKRGWVLREWEVKSNTDK